MTKVARFAGALACAATAGLWLVFLFANPYAAPGSFLLPAAMLLLAALGGAAAWLGKPYGLLAAALASFAPVGLYLLGTPGIFRGIGVLNLVALLAAALMLAGRRGAARGPSPPNPLSRPGP
jgi:hypothetical protein